MVTYHYTVTAQTCQEKKEYVETKLSRNAQLFCFVILSFRISVFGLGSVQVSVETLCQCSCDDSPVSGIALSWLINIHDYCSGIEPSIVQQRTWESHLW